MSCTSKSAARVLAVTPSLALYHQTPFVIILEIFPSVFRLTRQIHSSPLRPQRTFANPRHMTASMKIRRLQGRRMVIRMETVFWSHTTATATVSRTQMVILRRRTKYGPTQRVDVSEIMTSKQSLTRIIPPNDVKPMIPNPDSRSDSRL